MNPNLLRLANSMADPEINQARIEQEYQKLEQQLSIPQVLGFIYVPSIEKYVAEEIIHYNKNWYEAHEALHQQGQEMLTIPDFIGFLKFLKQSKQPKHRKMFKNIIKIKDYWRGEWLDAYFIVSKERLHILSRHETIEGKLIAQEKKEPCGYETEYSDIDFNDWLQRATSDGLPPKDIKKKNAKEFYYFEPSTHTVARFWANSSTSYLGCWDPSHSFEPMGVRPSFRKR